jgi:hypothetical protein
MCNGGGQKAKYNSQVDFEDDRKGKEENRINLSHRKQNIKNECFEEQHMV